MNDDAGFDVLRLIEHNQKCYISSDYVKGQSLVRQLKYHPNITKEQLMLWIHEIARCLSCIHKCQGGACYQYVTPYNIIVTDEGLFFLDMSAKSNTKVLNKMNHRSIRESFLPPEEQFYSRASIELDIYGYGKTIQYLLSETEITPKLKKHEELKLRKIISKCLCQHSKRAYVSMTELQKELPDYSKKRKKQKKDLDKKQPWKKVIVVCIVCLIMAVSGVHIIPTYLHQNNDQRETIHEFESYSEEADEKVYPEAEEADDFILQLALVYFLELKDYEKSSVYFRELKDEDLAESMADLSDALAGKKKPEEAHLREQLKKIENYIGQNEVTDKDYYRCLMRGYAMLDSEKDSRQVQMIGNKLLAEKLEDEPRMECMEYMARALERLKEFDEAIAMYEKLLEEDQMKTLDQEKIYENLSILWKGKGESGRALEICRKGIDKFPDSVDLKLQYIRMMCEDQGMSRDICAQTIKEYISKQPELKDRQEFQKLVQEYGIVIEGEEIWVGR